MAHFIGFFAVLLLATQILVGWSRRTPPHHPAPRVTLQEHKPFREELHITSHREQIFQGHKPYREETHANSYREQKNVQGHKSFRVETHNTRLRQHKASKSALRKVRQLVFKLSALRVSLFHLKDTLAHMRGEPPPRPKNLRPPDTSQRINKDAGHPPDTLPSFQKAQNKENGHPPNTQPSPQRDNRQGSDYSPNTQPSTLRDNRENGHPPITQSPPLRDHRQNVGPQNTQLPLQSSQSSVSPLPSAQFGVTVPLQRGPQGILPVNQQSSVTGPRPLPPYRAFIATAMKQVARASCKDYFCRIPVKRTFYDNGTLNMPPDRVLAWQQCGRKQFFLTKADAQADKIWRRCCELGGQPSGPLNTEELQCLRELHRKAADQKKVAIQSRYFTNFVDFGLDRRFQFCPEDAVFPAKLLAPGQPDNRDGAEACMAAELCPACDSGGLHDVNCFQPLRIVCQYELQINVSTLPDDQTTVTATEMKNHLITHSSKNHTQRVVELTETPSAEVKPTSSPPAPGSARPRVVLVIHHDEEDLEQ